MGEIVNYMQLDTGRLEHVAQSIHIVWDGALQVCVLFITFLVLYVYYVFVFNFLTVTVAFFLLFCVQICGYTFLLVQFLGPSVFAGIAAMFVILPLNSYFLRRYNLLFVLQCSK